MFGADPQRVADLERQLERLRSELDERERQFQFESDAFSSFVVAALTEIAGGAPAKSATNLLETFKRTIDAACARHKMDGWTGNGFVHHAAAMLQALRYSETD